MSDPLEQKIPDAELRRLAEERSAESASVLIELAVPRRTVEVRKTRRGGREVAVPVRVSRGSEEEVERVAAQAAELLENLLGEPPLRLRAARAFAATASGEQLAEIARSPLVQRISVNRRLRRR